MLDWEIRPKAALKKESEGLTHKYPPAKQIYSKIKVFGK